MTLAIASLAAHDAPAIEAHLRRLDPASRSLRFAAGVVTDASIGRYVEGLAFGRDLLFGMTSADGTLIAFAHGSVYAVAGRLHVEAAFSVDDGWRKSGRASALMQALERRAEAMGAAELVAMCVSRNLAMRSVFERARMHTLHEDGEVHARLAFAARPGEVTQ